MRRIIIALCLVGAGMTGVVAEGQTSPSEPVPAARELLEILEEAGDTPLSELTVSNLMQVADLGLLSRGSWFSARCFTLNLWRRVKSCLTPGRNMSNSYGWLPVGGVYGA